eukprot:3317094-Pyramimonas_sp.AAC.1
MGNAKTSPGEWVKISGGLRCEVTQGRTQPVLSLEATGPRTTPDNRKPSRTSKAFNRLAKERRAATKCDPFAASFPRFAS